MKRTRVLAAVGATLAVCTIGATLALAYASSASGLRARVRGLYEDLASRLRRRTGETHGDGATTKARERSTDQSVRLHVEHALEHGAAGRARSEAQSRKPHVRP